MVSPDHSKHRSGAVLYELLTIGDELLLGLTPNGHLSFIGDQLRRRGVTLQRNSTVTDDEGAIAAQFRESWAAADVVLLTGGLGPTCDDRTREAVSTVLERPLVFDAAVERAIVERFAQHGRKPTPNNLRQAYVLENCVVLPNPNGTAPGLWVEQDGRIACLLPGPPNELQPMLLDQVLPRLAAKGLLLEAEAYVQVRAAGVGESALETILQPVFDSAGPGLQVAFCAHEGQVDCRLSSPGARLDPARLESLAAECARILGEDFVCFGHDSLARICADLLRLENRTLGVAETATGGLLAHAFNDLCGAGKCLSGGVICPTNASAVQLLDIPECLLHQHGSASAENAVAMATGVAELLGTDYALATTGFAGPTGGPGENPVGTIYLGLFSPEGVWSRRLSVPGPRCTVKQRAVNAALDWLRREMIRAQRTRPPTGRKSRIMQ